VRRRLAIIRHVEEVTGNVALTWFGSYSGQAAAVALANLGAAAAAEVNVVAARRLWPRSLLQPPLANVDQHAPVDLANQQQCRP
jgi:hypothetical protein